MDKWDKDEKDNDEHSDVSSKIWVLSQNIILLNAKINKINDRLNLLIETYQSIERELTKIKKDYTNRLMSDNE